MNGEEKQPEMFGIGKAVKELQHGSTVARMGWNGPGQWLTLQVPDAGSKMTLPYVYIRTVQGDLVPWLCSQTDLLAVDWYAVDMAGRVGPDGRAVQP
jgi:hypothetical protein